MTIVHFLPPFDERELEEFEQLIGSTLPEEYRAFLLKHNGGKPVPSGFRFAKEGRAYSESCVEWLYGLRGDGEFFNSLEMHLRGSKGRMPPNIIPIGSDPGGNQICLSVSGPDRGSIFFWDHEKEVDPDDDEEPSYDNLYLIAMGFVSFSDILFD